MFYPHCLDTKYIRYFLYLFIFAIIYCAEISAMSCVYNWHSFDAFASILRLTHFPASFTADAFMIFSPKITKFNSPFSGSSLLSCLWWFSILKFSLKAQFRWKFADIWRKICFPLSTSHCFCFGLTSLSRHVMSRCPLDWKFEPKYWWVYWQTLCKRLKYY